MTKYKLIAIDIDGTLVNDEKNILPETMDAIIKAYKTGVHIVIATGRSYPAAAKYYNQFDFNLPLILYNGSCIRNSKNGEILLDRTFEQTLAAHIFKTINENNAVCCLWKNDTLYFNHNNIYSLEYERITSIKPNFIEDFDTFDLSGVYKFIWFDTPDKLEKVKTDVLANIDNINYFKSQKYMLEIVPTGISKGESLAHLAELLNVKQEEVIAIGDDENDISMISYAGLGVAMQNAKEVVKKTADFITDSNEKNGVGKVINKYVLE